MLRFLLWRAVQSVVVLLVVYTITFWMLMLVPGDPFIGERALSPTVRQALIKRYHLEGLIDPDPAHPSHKSHMAAKVKAFCTYGLGVLERGDFGPTVTYEDWTVNDVIKSSLPISVALGALAMLIAMWFGVIAGTFAALRRGKAVDVALTVTSLFGVSVPTFVIGTVLVLVFAVYKPIFPSGGWGSLRQLILPAISLAVYYIAIISRLTRMSVLDTAGADYVRTARAKGLPPRTVIGKHLLGNAVLPILSFLGPASAGVLTGSFVVEKIFEIPGLGRHFVNACLNTDVPLVLGAVMVYTAVVLVFNILVDIAYAALDPRTSLA
jgi:oligopeptide transport system permease protein